MRKWLALFLLVFVLPACGKKPDMIAMDLLKSGDRLQAIQVLEAARLQKSDQKPVRFLLFVVYQYMVVQGEPAKHDTYLQSAIEEYSWIAKDAGLSADYKDMDGSLKASDKTRPAYEAAYAAVYGR